jgi:glycosyltransferase involved in cell wall biosynthesis
MKTNKNDLVSVIIPAYNSEKYIEKCLDSVINQTYKNIEIIIVNDCSPDNVEEIITKYKQKDSRIIYLKNKVNMGVGPTRNKGIDNAKGKYLYFLDSDDYILPNCIEELYNAINEEDSFSCTTIGYKNIDGKITTFSRSKEELMLLEYPSVCIRLFNKDIIDSADIRFSNLRIGEDLEFVFKLLMYNDKVSFIEIPLFTYVIHNDSSIRTYNKTQIDVLKVLDNIEEYAKKINCYDKFYEIIEYVNVSHILVGAIKRIKSFDNYDKEDIQKCIDSVINKYPNWKKNKYVIKYLKDNEQLKGL